jgi:hypothetical protein
MYEEMGLWGPFGSDKRMPSAGQISRQINVSYYGSPPRTTRPLASRRWLGGTWIDSAGLLYACIFSGGIFTWTLLTPVAAGSTTPARVQVAHTGSTDPSSITATWGATTTAGNLLVAALAFDTASPSTPSGWTLALSKPGTNITTNLYCKANAAAQASQVFSLGGASNSSAVVVAEYRNIALVSPLDQTASASGNSAAPATGTTSTTTQAHELLIGALGNNPSGANTFSAPTNSFAIADQFTEPINSNASVALLDLVVTTTGTYTTGATAANKQWAGLIATFKAA